MIDKIIKGVRWVLVRLILLPVYIYRRVISPMTPPSCRHIPTCSQYAIDRCGQYSWSGEGLPDGHQPDPPLPSLGDVGLRPGATEGKDGEDSGTRRLGDGKKRGRLGEGEKGRVDLPIIGPEDS